MGRISTGGDGGDGSSARARAGCAAGRGDRRSGQHRGRRGLIGRTLAGVYRVYGELGEGPTLADLVRDRGPLSLADAIPIVDQVLHGLEAVAAAGIVHRDLSPHNLVLTPSGVVKLVDLGLPRHGQLVGPASDLRPDLYA